MLNKNVRFSFFFLEFHLRLRASYRHLHYNMPITEETGVKPANMYYICM